MLIKNRHISIEVRRRVTERYKADRLELAKNNLTKEWSKWEHVLHDWRSFKGYFLGQEDIRAPVVLSIADETFARISTAVKTFVWTTMGWGICCNYAGAFFRKMQDGLWRCSPDHNSIETCELSYSQKLTLKMSCLTRFLSQKRRSWGRGRKSTIVCSVIQIRAREDVRSVWLIIREEPPVSYYC